MKVTIIHEPSTSDTSIKLHIWAPGQNGQDVDGQVDGQGRIRFVYESEVLDPRDVAFKFRYMEREVSLWESDDFERRVPLLDAEQTIYTLDFTARCLLFDPREPHVAPDVVTFHVFTRSRFSGGELFAWNPAQPDQRQSFEQTARDGAQELSTFRVPLQPWMRDGFHFKFVNRKGEGSGDDDWEPDRSNRVWRPADGGEIWLKSGQISMRPQSFGLVSVPIKFVHAPGPSPRLILDDVIEDYHPELSLIGTVAFDTELQVSTYQAEIYPNALYQVRGADFSREAFSSPLRVWLDDANPPAPLFGTSQGRTLLKAAPQRDAQVEVIVQTNPNSAFDGVLTFEVYLGLAPDSLPLPQWSPYTRVQAAFDAASHSWRGSFQALGGISQSLRLTNGAGVFEARPDGPLQWQRSFTPPSGSTITYLTRDGIPVLIENSPDLEGAMPFADVALAERREAMTACFGQALTQANIFASYEMPHGATCTENDVWFVLRAPHALAAEVVLLAPTPAPPAVPVVTYLPMTLTPDLRYWWCRIPRAQVQHGDYYRFRLNGSNGPEVLDPASRWTHDPGHLSVQRDELSVLTPDGPGKGAWSRVVDSAVLKQVMTGSDWRTMGWQALLIYEMHPLRFTRRHLSPAGTPLQAFEQITEELKQDGYLRRLPVTALEFLPVHEFPSDQSWGYNPSLFWGVDSFYGGPEALAHCIRAAHDADKAVLLDVVYNHMSDSPLQQVARDVYVDGETAWGDMVNYDHPATVEFFRQATLYMSLTYQIDGFRFDSTESIINGDKINGYIIRQRPDGSWATGSGGGWPFLNELRQALQRAAGALGHPWPYTTGENDPNNWPMTDPGKPGVLDGQWHFAHHYRLNDAVPKDAPDKSGDIIDSMSWPHREQRPFYEGVRYAESHDSVSSQGGKHRIARRAGYDRGLRMAKATQAAIILAMGIPMLFMGGEGGEDLPFAFDLDQLDEPSRYMRLDLYEDRADPHHHVLAWCRDLMGLRNDPSKRLQGNDNQMVARGYKTVAFTRGGGGLFCVATFGTPDTRQNAGWLGLPANATYKEIFNSSWPAYQVENETEQSNGGYQAALRSDDILNLPSIGAVVFERF